MKNQIVRLSVKCTDLIKGIQLRRNMYMDLMLLRLCPFMSLWNRMSVAYFSFLPRSWSIATMNDSSPEWCHKDIKKLEDDCIQIELHHHFIFMEWRVSVLIQSFRTTPNVILVLLIQWINIPSARALLHFMNDFYHTHTFNSTVWKLLVSTRRFVKIRWNSFKHFTAFTCTILSSRPLQNWMIH